MYSGLQTNPSSIRAFDRCSGDSPKSPTYPPGCQPLIDLLCGIETIPKSFHAPITDEERERINCSVLIAAVLGGRMILRGILASVGRDKGALHV